MEIKSHEGAGPIRFGMSRDDVRAALGADFTSFKRNQYSVYPCDYFGVFRCFVYYDLQGLVEAIEFAKPATATLDGTNLLNLNFAKLIEKIRGIDPDVSVESDGLTSLQLGIGGWAPFANEQPDAPVEAIIVFVRKYYD